MKIIKKYEKCFINCGQVADVDKLNLFINIRWLDFLITGLLLQTRLNIVAANVWQFCFFRGVNPNVFQNKFNTY